MLELIFADTELRRDAREKELLLLNKSALALGTSWNTSASYSLTELFLVVGLMSNRARYGPRYCSQCFLQQSTFFRRGVFKY